VTQIKDQFYLDKSDLTAQMGKALTHRGAIGRTQLALTYNLTNKSQSQEGKFVRMLEVDEMRKFCAGTGLSFLSREKMTPDVSVSWQLIKRFPETKGGAD